MLKANILVAVLDWGLGHATRCVPIIKTLQSQGAHLTIACTPQLQKIFEKEFTNINFLSLPGYNIKYSPRKKLLLFSLLQQMPRLIFLLKKEQNWLKGVCLKNKFDAIISDNRFSFYHKKIPSVYITHQLFIETGNKFLNRLSQKIHYYYINKFSECWVPDSKETDGLAGKLSHPNQLPKIPVHYLGIYSRFIKMELPKTIDYLFILSGPEPQRTIFEHLILKQLSHLPTGKMVLVRGLPQDHTIETNLENLVVHNHVPAVELSYLIQTAKQIVCRSGYTSLLDLVSLQKAAYLIPTPGQTEQIYLAKYLNGKNGFIYDEQENFSLAKLAEKDKAPQQQQIKAVSNVEEVIKNFYESLKGITSP